MNKKERDAEDVEEQEEEGGGSEEVGWPKVARVEYWNALPEAISVRCPPFALLSCPLQASSSFPSRSLSLYLSSFLSVSPLCYASLHGRCGLSLFLASSYLYVRLSFSFLRVPFAKLRSIFHLELRRSLAINPRIHYGLRVPTAPSSRHPHAACPPICLPSYLPACLRRSSASLRFAGPPRRFRRVVFRVCDVIPGHWSDAGFREYRRNSFVRCRSFGTHRSYVSESLQIKYTHALLQYVLILLTPIFVNMCLLFETLSRYFFYVFCYISFWILIKLLILL